MNIDLNRRGLMVAAASTLAMSSALAACGPTTVSFATVQAYVADVDATLDRLVPLVGAVDPAVLPQLEALQREADAAAASFAALTSPASGATVAQDVLTYVSDAFSIAEAIPGIPPAYVDAISAAQLLMVFLGDFFGGVTPAPAAMDRLFAAGGPARDTWRSALSQYQASSDRPQLAAQYDARLRAFLQAH